MTEVAESRIESNGVTIAAADYGGMGPDVVLVHGGNRNLLDWTPPVRSCPGCA